MKKILAMIFLTASLSVSAQLVGETDAESLEKNSIQLSNDVRPVFLYPRCYWNGATGECTLQNYSPEDVVCHFEVRASTSRGFQYSNYQYRVLYRGMSAYTRVYANNPHYDPISFMTASAQCNTLR
jgi:hypothetical protein